MESRCLLTALKLLDVYQLTHLLKSDSLLGTTAAQHYFEKNAYSIYLIESLFFNKKMINFVPQGTFSLPRKKRLQVANLVPIDVFIAVSCTVVTVVSHLLCHLFMISHCSILVLTRIFSISSHQLCKNKPIFCPFPYPQFESSVFIGPFFEIFAQ